MKLVLTINDEDIVLEMGEARKVYDELKEIFDKKVERPYTGIRDIATRTYESNIMSFGDKTSCKTTCVTETPIIS